MAVPQNSKTELTNDPAIPLQGIYPKRFKIRDANRLCVHPYSQWIHTSRKVEATQVSIDERMDKMCYIRGDQYSALISKEILAWVTTWLNVELIMLSEKGQLQKDKHYLIPLISAMYQNLIQRQKVECGCQGLWGNGNVESLLYGYSFNRGK